MSDFITYNISKAAPDAAWDGGIKYLHLFRTDRYMESDTKQLRAELIKAFPAPEYQISEHRTPNSATHTIISEAPAAPEASSTGESKPSFSVGDHVLIEGDNRGVWVLYGTHAHDGALWADLEKQCSDDEEDTETTRALIGRLKRPPFALGQRVFCDSRNKAGHIAAYIQGDLPLVIEFDDGERDYYTMDGRFVTVAIQPSLTAI
jgi:hypothetical protein